jgi:hypothetical protein
VETVKDPNKPKGKPGRPVGGTALSNSGIRVLRAKEIIELRAKGVPVPEIAQSFRCSERSIYRIINWANDEGLMGELKEQALRRLGKLTIDAYEKALSAPDDTLPNVVEVHKMRLTAAKDAGQGIGLMSKKAETKSVEEIHSMQWFLEQRSKGEQTDGAENSSRYESVLDGDIVAEETPEALVEGDEQAGLQEQGDAGTDSERSDPELGDDEA